VLRGNREAGQLVRRQRKNRAAGLDLEAESEHEEAPVRVGDMNLPDPVDERAKRMARWRRVLDGVQDGPLSQRLELASAPEGIATIM